MQYVIVIHNKGNKICFISWVLPEQYNLYKQFVSARKNSAVFWEEYLFYANQAGCRGLKKPNWMQEAIASLAASILFPNTLSLSALSVPEAVSRHTGSLADSQGLHQTRISPWLQALSISAPQQLPLLGSLEATRSWLRTSFCYTWPWWGKGWGGSQVPFLWMRNQLLLPLGPRGFGGKVLSRFLYFPPTMWLFPLAMGTCSWPHLCLPGEDRSAGMASASPA